MDNHELAPVASSWADRYIADERGAGDYPAAAQGAGMISMAQVRGALWRQRYVVGGIVLVCLVLGLVATLLMRPVYQATATVRVDQQMGQIVEGQDLANPMIASNELPRYLKTLSAVIGSHSMALRVADKLGLDRDPAFVGDDKGDGKLQTRQARLDRAARKIAANVSVDAPGDTRIMAISYKSPGREEAARLANAYASLFVADDAQRSMDTNSYARQVLQQQIDATRDQLAKSEMQAVNYARANQLIMPMGSGSGGGDGGSSDGQSGGGGGGAQTLTGATLMSMNSARSGLVSARIQAEQHWNVVSGMPALSIPEVQQNSAIQTLQGQRADLAGQLAQLKQRYKAGYPQVDELTMQIHSLDQQIAQTASQIKASIKAQYEVAKQQEGAMDTEITKVSSQTLAEQDRQVEYSLLNRNTDALRQQMTSLMQRYNEIASASDIHANNLTLLDTAEAPASAVSPNIYKNMMLALGAGIVLAFGAALLREMLDDSLHSPEDVEAKLGVHLLGITPHVEVDKLEEAMGRAGALSEAYASLRTAIEYAAPAIPHRVIQFTSSQASEGKTTTSTSLAGQYAALGRRVLVIDADLRKPTIGRALIGRKAEHGLVDVLLGHRTFEDVAVSVSGSMDVIPCGHIPPNPVEILSSAAFAQFIESHRKAYDLVLIDSPPVIGLADAVLIGRVADHIVFVVEANRSHFGQAKAAMRRLGQVHAKVIGAVLTKYRAQEAGHSYEYAYNYYSYGKEN
ncbi:GumC family protein [Novosphingobium sp. 9]|uniref:GumC family protein n=1 Tax=Novosphingobium sp. 9 TaxID=2025349 RepID=UPI0021B53127|nr:polysaccharide biosynthesis tyrosine autokinase [Novosphingobium sp. 9]